MPIPSNYSEPAMSLPQAGNSAPGFANYGLSGIESVMNLDPFTPINELPPPYSTNSMLVSPIGNISQSTVLEPERFADVGSIMPSPLAPVPQRHSSLYWVLKHEFQASPAQGKMPSATSSIAHPLALELQERQTRLVPRPCTPAFGNRWDLSIGAFETSLSPSQIASTALAAMAKADARPAAPKLPTLPVGSTCQVQVRSRVSCATPPSTATMQAQKGFAGVTCWRGHMLASSPKVITNDYDTLPRVRKVSTPSTPCPTGIYER